MGTTGSAPGEFDEPHDIFVGGSQGRVYVADRKNNRIQVFDQDGNFIAAWHQFGQPSSVFVGKDDTIYVGACISRPGSKERRTARHRDRQCARRFAQGVHSRTRPTSTRSDVGTSASGIAADDAGNIYAADVGAHNLRKYMKVQ